MTEPVFRFAPSPNGDLHLGHALSAFLNHDAARAAGGRFLVRIEDIDGERSQPAFIARILDDLDWLGLAYETPVRRQSEHLGDYAAALDRLAGMGLLYPSFASRAENRRAIAAREAESGAPARCDPDGVPVDPGLDRARDPEDAGRRIENGEPHGLRIQMDVATALAGPLTWREDGDIVPPGLAPADPLAWGDVLLARKDAPASYHVAVVVDDALQGVTDVIRGVDLFHATSIHRLLQTLLGLPAPRYRHHR
ncbi:MAG TPA: tRNA glutamyl-Q(34) synthetase GluQRS, partial [Methylomirabilota bacterium]|nr:tRNA glutamyl-Q(34) synthetase GluQRS [Methylomirabilota bacterium]